MLFGVRVLMSGRIISLAVAVVALSGLAIGQFGAWWAPLDIFAQFTAQFLVLAALGLTAALLPRRALIVTAAAVPVACLVPSFFTAAYQGEAARPPFARAAKVAAVSTPPLGRSAADARQPDTHAANPPAFRLMTFNVLHKNRKVDAIIAEIARQDPDIVFLAEFGPNKPGLRRWLERRYPYAADCSHDWNCGLGLYSRFPVTNERIVEARDDAGPRRILVDVAIAGRQVHVVGAHLLSPLFGPSANYRELDFLGREVARIPDPVVVAGDFNATLFSNAFQNFRRKSGLTHMGHLIPSWPMRPVSLPQIGIDHVFMSSDLELYDVAAGRSAGSDHLPIAATIRLRR